jgi:IS5 family transposase
MKAHVGGESQTKLIHSVVATAANAADCTIAAPAARQRDVGVGRSKVSRPRRRAAGNMPPHAPGLHPRRYLLQHYIDDVEREKNRSKSSLRSKSEQEFAVMKLKCGFVKVRYRGPDKNTTQLFVMCARVNLFLVRKRLLRAIPA